MEHTKTPWTIADYTDSDSTIDIGHNIVTDGANGIITAEWVCEVGNGDGEITPEVEANAAFIVQAVNNHDKLVAALEALLRRCEVLGEADCPNSDLAAARDALSDPHKCPRKEAGK